MSKVYEFGDHRVREHLCGIYEFLEKKQLQSLQQLEASSLGSQPVKTESEQQPSAGRQSYLEQKERERERKQAERRVKQLEEHITQLEEQIADIERQLAEGSATDPDIYNRHASLNAQLQEAMQQWEECAEG